MTSNDTEIILLDNNTPKFKEKELSNKDNSKDKKKRFFFKRIGKIHGFNKTYKNK